MKHQLAEPDCYSCLSKQNDPDGGLRQHSKCLLCLANHSPSRYRGSHSARNHRL